VKTILTIALMSQMKLIPMKVLNQSHTYHLVSSKKRRRRLDSLVKQESSLREKIQKCLSELEHKTEEAETLGISDLEIVGEYHTLVIEILDNLAVLGEASAPEGSLEQEIRNLFIEFRKEYSIPNLIFYEIENIILGVVSAHEATRNKQLQDFRQEDLKVLLDEIERGCYKTQKDVFMEVIRLFDEKKLLGDGSSQESSKKEQKP
jgi:hypothetical protein